MNRIIAIFLLCSLSAPVFAEELLIPTEDNAAQLIQIEKTPILLQSHLRRRYAGYKITLTNKYPGNLELTSASIDNGVTGAIAAENTSTSYANILWGLPLWLLGMGIAAFVVSNKNHKAETESFQFPNQVPNTTLHKGDNVSFNVLVPTGQSPQLKFHFTDTKNSLEFSKASS